MAPGANGSANTGSSDTVTVTGGANGDIDVSGFWTRYESVKYGDVMKNVLIEDVLSRYEYLMKKHNEYVEEHKLEREYAKTWREREALLQGSVLQLQNICNRDPYVLVLIDGDGMIFNNNFLNQGEYGGKQAAAALHKVVLEWATTSILECPADTKVVVRVYANLKGLAEVCAKAGLVDTPAKLEDFARGFTRGRTLFDFVDVGPGKDRADGKVAETFKLYLFDYHCRQVIFGCSHDNGYARLLEEYADGKDSEEVMSRLTLLEGTPFEKELATLPFQTKKFPGIFRESKIVLPGQLDLLSDYRPRIDSRGTLNAGSDVFTPRTGTPGSVYSPPARTANLNGPSGLAMRTLHVRDDSASSSENTWASLAMKNAHRPLVDLKRTTSEQKDIIKRNKHGERLDIDLEYDRDEVQRVKKFKACNQHYIGKGCCHYNADKADKCPHGHHYKLTTAELKTLRVVARETPCKKGHSCEDPECIYGHRCPFPVATEGSMRGTGCLNGELCRFPRSMHGMDTVPVKTVKAAGAF